MRYWSALAAAFLLGAAVMFGVSFGWRPIDTLHERLRPATPHERYTRLLEENGLSQTALGREWLDAARQSLDRPVAITAPFTQQARIDPAGAAALGYAVKLARGQTFDVHVQAGPNSPGQIFVDLFAPAVDDASAPRRVASAKPGESTLSHEARESGVYLLRIQTELLRGGQLRIASTPAPSLAFPVSGGGAGQIRSVFGDPRDAGARRHEGVDIFAPRGTPVVAAADALVVRVNETPRGGRVVWLLDLSRGVSFYYAHLHEQLVRTGEFVREGETLGTVGNTGNARTTPPHLHFGIYAHGEGAIDPAGYIRPVAAAAGP
jgi:murein DD-endopeptidase MepM/ murein hydrolase activator NlpD